MGFGTNGGLAVTSAGPEMRPLGTSPKL